MITGIVCEQGLRESMEDTYYLDTNFAGQGWIFGGVFDGHRGKFAAQEAAHRLPQVFLEQLGCYKNPMQAFSVAYSDVADDLRSCYSGTTATTFLIRDQTIYLSHVGDSRALTIDKQDFSQLSSDHRLENHDERTRIEQCGAQIFYPYIYQDGQGIMLTRTLGDCDFKDLGVIDTPSQSEHAITQQDKTMLLATDGLFDALSNREIFQLTRNNHDPQKIADSLLEEAMLNRMSPDNITILSINLQEISNLSS